MAMPDGKSTMVGETYSPSSSTLNTHDVKSVRDNASEDPEKPTQGVFDDEYPRGLRLAMLVGATVIAVFLIALDQVCHLHAFSDLSNNDSDANASRLSSEQQSLRSRTSFMASMTCPGMPPPTS